jgi:pimeloyl-ACP methyl ester carboxylesterase
VSGSRPARVRQAPHLDGVVEKITVPFLIAHGEKDRRIPLEYAHRSYEQAVNSPRRELRVFTPEEGATEHIGLDHLPHVSTYIADRVADTFATTRGQRGK